MARASVSLRGDRLFSSTHIGASVECAARPRPPGRVDRLCELTWIARKILGGAVDCAEDPDCEKCPNAKCIKEDECDHCFCPKECPGYIGEPNGG